MPVSWEMASGPTVAFNMSGQGSTCAAVEGPKGSNFSNFRVQDTMPRSFINTGEAIKGSNYRLPSANDAVVRGLSALSLCGQYEADSTGDESGSNSLGALCCGSPDLYRCTPPGNIESSPFALAPASVCSKPLGSGSLARNVDFIQHNVHTQASTNDNGSGRLSPQMDTSDRMTFNRVYCRASPNSNGFGGEVLQQDCLHRVYDTFWSATIQESRNEEDVDLDLTSESSISLENSIPDTSSSSVEAVQASDDTEAQSDFKEAANLSCSVGTSFSPRKGLSQFYAGKSRSFSCLRDAVSVKDLSKPESPHMKKRKVTSSNSRLPPLQKGSAGISKKPMQNCKSTLALAVAMSTKEENELQSSSENSRSPKSLVQSRSYSLSDLQGASGSLFFIG